METKMPNNWKKYKLGDLADITSSKRIFLSDYVTEGIPFYRSKEIIDLFHKRDIKTELFISKDKYEEIKHKFGIPLGGDLLLTSVGTLGIPYIVKDNDVFYFKDGNLTWFRKINNLYIDNKYLFIIISSDYGKKKLNEITIGSTQAALTIYGLKNIEITLPPLPEQQAIAEILSSLDDKIELNLQTNKTLEEMANALYKHWFVDFGPFKEGKFVESELGLVPINWEVKELRENLSILKDGSHNPPKRTEEGVRFLAGATDIKHLTISFEKCSFISQEDYDQMHRKYHIQKDDILLTIVGTIGNVAIVRESDLPFSMQRSIAILRASDTFSNKYIYLLLNSLSFKHYMNTNINPTGQPGIYLGTLGSYKLVTPPIDELKRFEKTVEPVFEQMFQNVTENESLKQTRDYLLPKLISGKIRVKEAAQKVKEVL
jgi:type I restriction enzyme S subunit